MLGVARVPDPRLDVLTAMYNPRKRVPATVEFADIPGRPAGTGADALLDVAAYRNADALVHVVRSFTDPAIPHAAGSVDPRRDARAMEDELILADLAVVEKRLERLEKDLKKTRTADLEKEREILNRCRPHLESGSPLRVLDLGGDDRQPAARVPVPVGQAAADGAQRRRGRSRLPGSTTCSRSTAWRSSGRARTRAPWRCARRSSSRSRSSSRPTRPRSWPTSASPRPGWIGSSARATSCSATSRSSRSARTSAARGPFPAGRRRRRRPGRSTRIIARGFIRAEVVAYDRLVARGSMAACSDHGEVRLEGKEYTVQDGDIVNVRFAT